VGPRYSYAPICRQGSCSRLPWIHPFELVFGRTVRGPLKLLKENWLAIEPPTNILDQVSDLRQRLTSACDIAQKNMKATQHRMKTWYDKKARHRTFEVGEKVLALLSLPNQPLQARFCGPYMYVVTKRVGDVNYVIDTPDRRKTQRLCHVNMLKSYWERGNVAKIAIVAPVSRQVEDATVSEDTVSTDDVMMSSSCTLQNSDILANLMKQLSHLPQQQVSDLIMEFVDLFPDTPKRTSCVHHDVDVMGATPIKQHPYRVNPVKLKFLRNEVEHMMADGQWHHRAQQ